MSEYHKVFVPYDVADTKQPEQWLYDRYQTSRTRVNDHLFYYKLAFDGHYYIGINFFIFDPEVAMEFKLMWSGQ